ncbi:MLO-like protein 1 [Syzygium oleosum]|uniref:MLO-like protein 1 n=1 Tax=Syzygium oleosum TaxID=219896 RepID=UPI0024B96B30|nr:MLO-like protein 1 [Syzygium oleosum]
MVVQLARQVAEKHTQNENESSKNSAEGLVFEFSKDDFWFGRPNLIGNLVHTLLFLNSLELAFFFFILFQYGFHSCIMGKIGFVVPRIVMGVFVQVLCMSRILPLYAIIKSQVHLKEKQSDKHNIEKIKMLLKENQLDELIEECLDDLDEIKIRLKENEMDEEEEMWIVISKWIDKGKKPSSTEEATNIESTRTDSTEGSVGVEITESGHMNSTGDIEAQNRQPSLHQH